MDEEKVERSIVVSARVDMLALAKMDRYWLSKGTPVKSMSQLINWTVDLMAQVLEANGLKVEGLNSAKEANDHFRFRGLYQGSNVKRSRQKIATAIRFEGMRKEGLDPRGEDPLSYTTMHNSKSVQPAEEVYRDGVKVLSKEEADYWIRKADEQRADRERKEARAAADEAIKTMPNVIRADCQNKHIMAENEVNKEQVMAENDLASQLEFLKNKVVK